MRDKPFFSTREIAVTGLLLAVALVLSCFEALLSGLMALPPGVKPGLSNVTVLFALLFLGRRSAVAVVLLKSLFVFLARGATAGILSLSGGGCAIAAMLLLAYTRVFRVSAWVLSVAGSTAHNAGQVLAAAALIRNPYILLYFPILLVAGIAAGLLTAAVFMAARPGFQRTVQIWVQKK